jgi:hypothetical protein
MSNNPKQNQNIESEAPANEENEEQEEGMEGEGSATHRPHGDSDPSIKNH